MNSTDMYLNGDSPREAQEESGAVSPTLRMVEDTAGMTDNQTNESADTEFSSEHIDRSLVSSKRVNPDSGVFIRVVMTGVAIAGLVAFAISFVALYSVAEWLGLPSWMWWAVPVFIDLAILVYAGLVLVHKARGESTWPSWVALGAFTVLSVVANSAHALAHDHDAPWQAYIGVLIAAMVPIAIFVATEQLSRVAIQDLNSQKAELREQLDLETFEAQQQQQRDELAFQREQQRWQRETERAKAQREAELAQREHEMAVAQMVNETPKGAQPVAAPVPRPQAAMDDAPEVSQRQTNDEELAAFVREHVQHGVEITGSLVANHLGVSDRTGRRRIKALQEASPELFISDASNAADTMVIDDE